MIYKKKYIMMICENCKKEHDGEYGSGRFCSSKCARCFSTKIKRLSINERVSAKLKGVYLITGEPAHDDVLKICKQCGREFKVPYYKRNIICCSVQCKSNYVRLSPEGVHPVVAWRQRLKLKAIEYKGGKCEVCGYNKIVRPLVFHHRDPSKKEFAIGGNGTPMKWDRVQLELDKCMLLCGNCHRAKHYEFDVTKSYSIMSRHRIKAKMIEYKGGKCQICGYNECHGSLTFHHIDPNEKEISIGSMVRKWEKIKPELDKCLLVCSNCHDEIHQGIIDPNELKTIIERQVL
jgi:predicted metal-binding protein